MYSWHAVDSGAPGVPSSRPPCLGPPPLEIDKLGELPDVNPCRSTPSDTGGVHFILHAMRDSSGPGLERGDHREGLDHRISTHSPAPSVV